MKKMILFCVFAMTTAHAQAADLTYNECRKVGDPRSGIYFENGYAPVSANSSDHFFENMIIILDGRTEVHNIGGDSLYRATCVATADSKAELGLSRQYRQKADMRFKCGDNTQLEVQFDLSAPTAKNGRVRRTLPNGNTIGFDLECGK